MLREPLTLEQIDAANRLHELLPQWRTSDNALYTLASLMPGWSAEEALIKCAAVNTLYGTQVLAIIRMAEHVRHFFPNYPDKCNQSLLVQRIAELDKNRKRVSFASKLCHFFVSADFPIYDDAARDTLKFHLGEHYITKQNSPYDGLRENLRRTNGNSSGKHGL